jgi:hypothetical protein
MAIRIGKVEELFVLRAGLVVVTDTTYERLPAELAITIGSSIEFRQADGLHFGAEVKGIEHGHPWTPRSKFAFLLSSSVSKDQIQIGAEFGQMPRARPALNHGPQKVLTRFAKNDPEEPTG